MFMAAMSGWKTVGTFHEPTPLPACGHPLPARRGEGRERGDLKRFMAPTHVLSLEVFPLHEPPLSRPAATLSPQGGERAGSGVPIWFMASIRVRILEVFPSHEPYPLILSFSPSGGRRCPEGG